MKITGGTLFNAITFITLDTSPETTVTCALQESEFLNMYKQVPYTKESEPTYDKVESTDLRKDFNETIFDHCKKLVMKEQNIEQIIKRDTSGKPVPMNASTLEKTGMRSVYRDAARTFFPYLSEDQQKNINEIYPDWYN